MFQLILLEVDMLYIVRFKIQNSVTSIIIVGFKKKSIVKEFLT